MRIKLTSALAALALACPSAAASDPLTLDTLLGLEGFGRIAIDPTGSVAVFEERRSRDELPRYDLQPEGMLRYARLYRVSLDAPDRVEPLLSMAPDAGYTFGPFSPSGRRVIVYRLQNLTFRLGVVNLADGEVLWTELSPDTGAWGRSVEWISDDAFVALTLPEGALPPRLAGQIVTQTRLPELWAQAARGEPAYVSTGATESDILTAVRELRRVDARTGRSDILSRGPFLDLEASPDGRFVALLQDGPARPLANDDAASQAQRARPLRVVDIDTASSIDPPEGRDIAPTLLSWSPRSDGLLVLALDGTSPRLLSIAPSGGVRDVTPEGVTPSVVIDAQVTPTAEAAWLGRTVVVKGVKDGLRGWYGERDGAARQIEGLADTARIIAQGDVALIFASDGRTLRLTGSPSIEDLGEVTSASRPDGPFGNRGLTSPMKARFAVMTDGQDRRCRVSTDAESTSCVRAASGSAISWSRGVSVATGVGGRASNRLTLQGASGDRILWTLNPELEAIDVSPPRRVTGADGARGWLYLPARAESEPPPVIVIPYPGRVLPTPPRNMQLESAHVTQNGALLVSAGYAVLYPDLPTVAEPSDRLAERILAVVDEAAADGLVDSRRIGLWGHSFGAWASVLSATQSDRFGAVVALNGSYDLPLALAFISQHDRIVGANDFAIDGSARWLEAGQAGMQRSYWRDPERYRRGSAFEQADTMTAPVLLMHGEFDLSSGQAEQMYAALRRLHRPAALTYFFGEDHSIHNPGNVRIYYQQVLAWFDRYLRPAGVPDASSSASPRPPSAPD